MRRESDLSRRLFAAESREKQLEDERDALRIQIDGMYEAKLAQQKEVRDLREAFNKERIELLERIERQRNEITYLSSAYAHLKSGQPAKAERLRQYAREEMEAHEW